MEPVPGGGAAPTAGTSPTGTTGTADFTVKTVLEGDLIRLVPAVREHAATLHGLLADPEVGRLTGSVHTSDAGHDGSAAASPWNVARLEEI